MTKHYSVEAFDKGNLVLRVTFAKATARESIIAALQYCEYLIGEGFACNVKQENELITEFRAVNI